jgi:hypothetical protein
VRAGAWRVAATAIWLIAACGPPAATTLQGDDPALLQEVVSRQERRVTDAQTQIAKLEHELRMIRMRRRMLERAGRHDLASNLEMEEHGLMSQLSNAHSAAADEEDALVIYRNQSASAGPHSPS